MSYAKGIKVADSIKLGNQLTLRWGEYPGLFWAQGCREFRSRIVLKYNESLSKGREHLEYAWVCTEIIIILTHPDLH